MHALCSEVGCIKTESLADLQVGVTLTNGDDSVVLLPGSYTPDTASASQDATKILQPFLYQTVPQTAVQGFAIDLSKSPAVVSLTSAASVLAFGEAFYQGSDGSTTSISSLLLRNDAFAILKIAGGPITSVQVHDGIYDVAAWNMGAEATFTLDGVHPRTDIKDSSQYCRRAFYRDKDTCSPCADACASCYGPSARQCLSCDSRSRLASGSCVSISCLGGASVVPGMGVCTEELAKMPEPFAIGKSSLSTSSAAIIVPCAIGAAILLLILFYVYKSRQKRKLAARAPLHSWANQAFQRTPLPPQSYPSVQTPYGNPVFRHSGDRSDASSRSYDYESSTRYSVPPESDGGPSPQDAWEAKQIELMRRKDMELARLRQEVQQSRRVSPNGKARRRAYTLTSPPGLAEEWEMEQLEQLAHDFDEASTVVSAVSSKRLKSPPARRIKHSPADINTKIAKRTTPTLFTPRTGLTRLEDWRSDLGRKRPDPVPPAQTIATTQVVAPATPATGRSASTPQTATTQQFARIEQWARQPKPQLEGPAKTIIGVETTVFVPPDDASTCAPTIVKGHARTASKNSRGSVKSLAKSPKSEFSTGSYLTSISRAQQHRLDKLKEGG